MNPRVPCIALGFLAATISLWTGVVRAQSPDTVRGGIVVDGPWERNQQITELLRQEMIALLSGDVEVEDKEQA